MNPYESPAAVEDVQPFDSERLAFLVAAALFGLSPILYLAGIGTMAAAVVMLRMGFDNTFDILLTGIGVTASSIVPFTIGVFWTVWMSQCSS